MLIKATFNPNKNPKYSASFFRWLRGHSIKELVVMRARSGAIHIGVMRDQEYYCKSIISIFRGYYGYTVNPLRPISKERFDTSTNITDWFWSNYEQIGMCVVDPDHKGHFLYSGKQYTIDQTEDRRTCNWCGDKFKMVETEKTIINRGWVKI